LSDTSSTYRRRVPLTTLTTAEDLKFEASFQRKTTDLTRTENSNEDELNSSRPNHTSSLKLAVTSNKDASADNSSDLTKAIVTSTSNPPTVASIRPGLSGTNVQLPTPVLPSSPKNAELSSMTFFTYRVQLTFGLPTPSDGVNVTKYFHRWIYSCSESIDHFTLVPYEDEKGLQISSLDQVPEDNADFYATYYHNHRVLNHGNLTGMVQFQCSTP
jgi:hypothetical protein